MCEPCSDLVGNDLVREVALRIGGVVIGVSNLNINKVQHSILEEVYLYILAYIYIYIYIYTHTLYICINTYIY